MLKAKLLGATAGAEAALAIEDVFSTYLYAGGTAQQINNGIDLDTEGGMVWIKRRNSTFAHQIFDTQRTSATYGTPTRLSTNTTSAADVYFTTGEFSWLADGFDLNNTDGGVNGSGGTYASWTFRKAPRFFDVVTYTGTGSSSQTISHNLGVTPAVIIIKNTTTAVYNGDWHTYHKDVYNASNGFLRLNATDAVQSRSVCNSFIGSVTGINDTSFTVNAGTSINDLTASGSTYVAYLFAHDPLGPSGDGSDGLIACGSFTATGAEQEIDVGFEPQFVIRKVTNAVAGWAMFDNMRGFSQTNTAYLYANLSNVEANYTGADNDKTTPRGFKFTGVNGQTHIYIAIRRGPMREPTVGTQVFKALVRTGTASNTTVSGFGFPVDLVTSLFRPYSQDVWFDRLRGASRQIATTSYGAETTQSASINGFDVMDGYKVGIDNVTNMTNGNTSANGYLNYAFRRAPGFFDMVAYTGDNTSSRQIPHNLKVVPEFIILMQRSVGSQWFCWHTNYTGPGLYLNGDVLWPSDSQIIQQSGHTDSTFGVLNNYSMNASGRTYIVYLFASLPGISKVGSYTGNGSSQTINCAFTTGARFVLIKRTSGTGDWYVWDTARGIVSGNDPHLSLNTTAAEVTSDDTIDPDNSGFIVNQVAATNVNVNAATYIYLAIA